MNRHLFNFQLWMGHALLFYYRLQRFGQHILIVHGNRDQPRPVRMLQMSMASLLPDDGKTGAFQRFQNVLWF